MVDDQTRETGQRAGAKKVYAAAPTAPGTRAGNPENNLQ